MIFHRVIRLVLSFSEVEQETVAMVQMIRVSAST